MIATGETHSVREFVEATFSHLKLDWSSHVIIEQLVLVRPSEVDHLEG